MAWTQKGKAKELQLEQLCRFISTSVDTLNQGITDYNAFVADYNPIAGTDPLSEIDAPVTSGLNDSIAAVIVDNHVITWSEYRRSHWGHRPEDYKTFLETNLQTILDAYSLLEGKNQEAKTKVLNRINSLETSAGDAAKTAKKELDMLNALYASLEADKNKLDGEKTALQTELDGVKKTLEGYVTKYGQLETTVDVSGYNDQPRDVVLAKMAELYRGVSQPATLEKGERESQVAYQAKLRVQDKAVEGSALELSALAALAAGKFPDNRNIRLFKALSHYEEEAIDKFVADAVTATDQFYVAIVKPVVDGKQPPVDIDGPVNKEDIAELYFRLADVFADLEGVHYLDRANVLRDLDKAAKDKLAELSDYVGKFETVDSDFKTKYDAEIKALTVGMDVRDKHGKAVISLESAKALSEKPILTVSNLEELKALYDGVIATHEAIKDYKGSKKVEDSVTQLGEAVPDATKMRDAIKVYLDAYGKLTDDQKKEFTAGLESYVKPENMYVDTDAVIASNEAIVAAVPNYIQGHYNLAQAYAKKGQVGQAISELRTVLELSGKVDDAYEPARFTLALQLTNTGQFGGEDGAETTFRDLIKILCDKNPDAVPTAEKLKKVKPDYLDLQRRIDSAGTSRASLGATPVDYDALAAMDRKITACYMPTSP